jgi:hypothetical protein
MGKSGRNRNRGPRADPIAKPVKPLSDPELISLRESRILPVVKDLQSSDIKSRTAAAGAIANIVQDAKCRKLLLREQIVHIVLTETLTDSSIESRTAGWNILNVLAQEEESDFLVHLFRLDILTAMEYAGKTVRSLRNPTVVRKIDGVYRSSVRSPPKKHRLRNHQNCSRNVSWRWLVVLSS